MRRLFRAFSAGSLTAEEFAALFEEQARLLWVVAAAHASRAEADDVLQEAALVALRKLHTFTPGTRFSAWMSQIVRFVASDARRKRRAELLADRGVEPDAVPSRGQAELPDEDLLRALAELPAAARECLLLQAVLGQSTAEIAAHLQIPENTVSSHLHRARAALRERLAPADRTMPTP